MYTILNKNQIRNDETQVTFPIDSKNRHYQMYQIWAKNPQNVPNVDQNSLLCIVETQAQDAKYIKEGSPDLSEQPMVPERWSDGINTVYSEEDIPVVDGQPDVDYLYMPSTADDSYTFVPAIPYSYEVCDDESAIRQKEANDKLNAIRALRNGLLAKADVMINIAIDNSDDNLDELKAYRIALRNCTEDLKKSNGDAYVSVADINIEEFGFPELG